MYLLYILDEITESSEILNLLSLLKISSFPRSKMSQEPMFTFKSLPQPKLSGFEKDSTQALLSKWALKDGLKVQAFSFDSNFKSYHEESFVQDFFADPEVISTFLKASKWENDSFHFTPLGFPSESTQMEKIPCTATSMDTFEKLSNQENINRVVRPFGTIIKCQPEFLKIYTENGEFFTEIEIADELRKMILTPEDSEFTDIFTDNDKSQFVFKIFEHLVIGGVLCQYEDVIDDYLETTKLIYKDLVSVVKSEDGFKTTTHTIKIHGIKNENYSQVQNLLFCRSHVNNFLYLVINPLKKMCITFYHQV